MDEAAVARVDEAVAFADASPFPTPESLYDDVYVLGGQVRGWYSVDERTPEPHKGEDEREMARGELAGGEEYDRHAAGAHEARPADDAQREAD
jgi:hypothetical protein